MCQAWRAPIVGAGSEQGCLGLGEGTIEREELWPTRADRLGVPVDRLPVAADERPGVVEAILDGAEHERLERLGRRPDRVHELGGDVVERDEVRGGEVRGRVVEGARLVVELESLQPEKLGELARRAQRLVALPGHGSPGTVELLGPTVERERL
jgi:hypothetical protein